MLSGLLDRLRPKNDTAEAMASALAETETALAAAAQRVAGLEAGRGAALLEGGEVARRQEAALRDARDEAERLAALAETLRAKHAEAVTRERRAALQQEMVEAEREAADFVADLQRDYPKHAAAIAALCRREAAVTKRMIELQGRLMEGMRVGDVPEDVRAPVLPVQRYWAERDTTPRPIADRVLLPAIGGSDAPAFWPPPRH